MFLARCIIFQISFVEYNFLVFVINAIYVIFSEYQRCVITGRCDHCSDVIMSAMDSQITSLTIVYSTFYSGADQRKRQSSASLAFVQGIHRWPVNSPRKRPVTRNIFPLDDVIKINTVIAPSVTSVVMGRAHLKSQMRVWKYQIGWIPEFVNWPVVTKPGLFTVDHVQSLIRFYKFDL